MSFQAVVLLKPGFHKASFDQDNDQSKQSD